jgi:membrane protease YdiL (CAAX protease family)
MPTESPQIPDAARAACPRATENTFRVRDGLIVILVLVAAGGLVTLLARGGFIPRGLSWQVATTAIAQALVIAVVLGLARRRRVSLRSLVLRDGSRWPVEVLWGLSLAFLFLTGMAVAWLLGMPLVDPLEQVIGNAPLAVRLEFLVLAAVLAPISEELLYRGVVQSSLAPRFGLVLACILQAALFGLMHPRGWVLMLAVFVGGLAYGALALWRGCLLPSIVAHAGANGVIAGWLLALFWLNAHTPASTMAEAQQEPAWRSQPPLLAIPHKETAQEQYEAALRRFGSFGLQLRKDQIKAFETVRERFPKDDEFGAWSMLGVQEVYLRYLDDPRRAIIVGERLLAEYPHQHKAQAQAVLRIVEAHLRLPQFDEARQWLERAEIEYGEAEGIESRAAALRNILEAQSTERK